VESSLQHIIMIKRDDAHISALVLICFAKVAQYCFEKLCSVKLSKTFYCQIFELILFRFSQVALYCYYLENILSAKQVNCSHNKLFFVKCSLFFA